MFLPYKKDKEMFYECAMNQICTAKQSTENMTVWEFEAGNYEKNTVIFNSKTEKWLVDFRDRVDFYDSILESKRFIKYLDEQLKGADQYIVLGEKA